LTKVCDVQIRSFVLGGNHGQYLQAAGLAKAVKEAAPHTQVTHARYNNHLLDELKVQTRSLHLPKYLAMRRHWQRQIAFSPLDHDARARIYGADQIWSFSNALFPPNPVFFGKGDTVHKIAYAPSMGHVTEGFIFPGWASDALARFQAIAARDAATAAAVERSLGVRPPIVVDPAFFLINHEDSFPERREEIAIYSPNARYIMQRLLGALDNVNGRWPVQLYGYLPKRQMYGQFSNQLVMPEALVSRIAQARILITSTFHGVIMALMTGTPFIALASSSLVDRLDSPLGQTTFDRFRLMNAERFAELGSEDINRALDPSDIDRVRISELTAQSRTWLSARVSEALA